MCVIIRSSASASASGAPVATTGSFPLTYQQQREKNIQRNNDKLRQLGIVLKPGGGDEYDPTNRQEEFKGSHSDSDDSYHPSNNGDDDEDDA